MIDRFFVGPSYALPLVVGTATGLATLAGGSLALRFRSSRELLTGLSGGALIGVALCDLLPEALELARGSRAVLDMTIAVAAGFVAYLAADAAAGVAKGGGRERRRHLGPASLALHSLTDGLGIGLAFHVSSAIGLVVAGAVLVHDLVDGVNSVAVSLHGGADPPTARRWLLTNALAPLAGIELARLISIPQSALAMALALFSGFLLYLGASTLLRPVDDRPSRLATTVTTVLGLALICSIIWLNAPP